MSSLSSPSSQSSSRTTSSKMSSEKSVSFLPESFWISSQFLSLYPQVRQHLQKCFQKSRFIDTRYHLTFDHKEFLPRILFATSNPLRKLGIKGVRKIHNSTCLQKSLQSPSHFEPSKARNSPCKPDRTGQKSVWSL